MVQAPVSGTGRQGFEFLHSDILFEDGWPSGLGAGLWPQLAKALREFKSHPALHLKKDKIMKNYGRTYNYKNGDFVEYIVKGHHGKAILLNATTHWLENPSYYIDDTDNTYGIIAASEIVKLLSEDEKLVYLFEKG